MRARTWISKVALIGATALIGGRAFAAGDVSISNPDPAWGTAFSPYSDAAPIAQTFKAGFNQILTGIELTHGTWSGPLVAADLSLYRVTSAITPVGDLLAHLTITPQQGTHLIDFAPFQVELRQGESYSLVFGSKWGTENAVAFTSGIHDERFNYFDSFADGMMWSKTGTAWAPFASWVSRDAAGTSDVIMKTFGNPLPVPEPSTIVLLALGLLSLGFLRRTSAY
jgi:hypothetical protein